MTKGIICFYSGSGNTKTACQYIAHKVTNVKFDFFDITINKTPVFNEYDIIGFATFADFGGPPYLMQQFIEKFDNMENKYAFVFNTFGFIGGKTLKVLGKLVKESGFKVIAGYSLHTPENYPPMITKGMANLQAPNEKEMKHFNDFIMKLDKLALLIQEKKEIKEKKIRVSIFNMLIPTHSRKHASKDMGEKFVDESLCNECKICEEMCPYNAIICDPIPVFDENKCYGCWACYHHCPKKAIYTKKYNGVGNYPKPCKEFIEKFDISD